MKCIKSALLSHKLINQRLERTQNIAPNETTGLHSELSMRSTSKCKLSTLRIFLIKWSEMNLAMTMENWLERVSLGPENQGQKTLIIYFRIFLRRLWIDIQVRIIQDLILQLYLRLLPKDSDIGVPNVSILINLVESPQISPTNDECHWIPMTNGSVSCSKI